ncbi:MAG: DeoR/GlpR family DNA-binding transcription regulator [Gordonia sp. (in: high G+C Gram-positive bacteria)]|uniref:DeoR/GlpR family DNA-binding transcription regulator n=1 Tax=Gordonia sp. (in: high G+C Gram-positive bacteria) TaxID=84139 RepID=UPI003C794C50
MYAEERQSSIASEVRSRGRVSVADLAARFSVTGETVRRDLAILQRSGQLVRVHGGAVRPDVAAVVEEPDLAIREQSRRIEKTAIGVAALALLPAAGGSVLIDAGTTTLQLASAIHPDTRLTFITNSIQVGGVLAALPGSAVMLTGGRLRPTTGATVGADAVAMLSTVRASVGFLGTNALSVGHGLSTPDADEAAVKRAMIAACGTTVVLADSSKINREELVRFGTLDDIDVVITDTGIDPGFVSELRAHDIEVVVA